jgi:iron complex transport system substrate-binding protein
MVIYRRAAVIASALAISLALLFVSFASAHVATRPTRIISLSPTATEDLFAIGAGSQVIAVDNESDYPANAPHSKLSGYTPNVEAIAKYNPDLVVASFDANGLVKGLGKLHIPILLQTPAANLGNAYAQIKALGAATGHVSGAAKVVAKMQSRIKAIVASTPKSVRELTYYEEFSPDYYSATSKTFGGSVLKLLGLKNIADAADKHGTGYPQLSAEVIVAADPDLIVLADTRCCGETAAKIKSRPGWSGIAAVKDGGIVGVNDDIASRWGPRIVNFLSAVAARAKIVAASH